MAGLLYSMLLRSKSFGMALSQLVLVFFLGGGYGLPLHIAWGIRSPGAKRDDMIDDVSRAGQAIPTGSWTWILFDEGMTRGSAAWLPGKRERA